MLFSTLLCLVSLASAKVVTYDWSFAWINAAPDGFNRPVIAINSQFPLPPINVTLGDQLVINVVNNLGNVSATLHFHGLYQRNTTAMDGPAGVTQCGLVPGGKQTYAFTVNQPGTYFYHSHFEGQYPDGLRGALIVHDPRPPFQYDEEIGLTMSDWYHDQMSHLTSYYLSNDMNPDSPEPIPSSALINDSQEVKLNVLPNKTYYLRLINFSAFAQFYFKIDQHQLSIVEIDGIYTQSQTVDTLYIATAQRYGVLLKTKATATTNYAALAKMDETKFDGYGESTYPTSSCNSNANAYLIYNGAITALPTPLNQTLDTLSTQVFDDFNLVPYDQQPLLRNPTQSFVMELSFFTQDGQNRAGFDNITWLPQKVPSLMTALTTGQAATNNLTYGVNANAMVLNYNEIIEVVINNSDGGAHPIHIHGHAPQIVARASSGAYVPTQGNENTMPKIPMRRDTWMLAAGGYTVIRFKADNPGVWFFHCHMDWHNIAGLAATFIEAPLELQKTQSVPAAWNNMCTDQGLMAKGNAAGNTQNYSDLTGANTVCPPLTPYVGPKPQ